MKKLPIYLIAATSCFASSWFVEPTAGLVFPKDSKATYYGMDATVKYDNGQAFGINAGRTFGNFKTYLSYDHTSFTAREIAVQTPYGLQKQSLSDDYEGHTICVNGDFTARMGRWAGVCASIGSGYTFSEYSSQVYSAGISIRKRLKVADVSLGTTYRVTPKDIQLKHKTISQPDQIHYTLSVSKQF